MSSPKLTSYARKQRPTFVLKAAEEDLTQLNHLLDNVRHIRKEISQVVVDALKAKISEVWSCGAIIILSGSTNRK